MSRRKIRLFVIIWAKCSLLHIRGLRPLLIALRNISLEENVAKFHSQWIFISREENFAQNPSSRIYCAAIFIIFINPIWRRKHNWCIASIIQNSHLFCAIITDRLTDWCVPWVLEVLDQGILYVTREYALMLSSNKWWICHILFSDRLPLIFLLSWILMVHVLAWFVCISLCFTADILLFNV